MKASVGVEDKVEVPLQDDQELQGHHFRALEDEEEAQHHFLVSEDEEEAQHCFLA